MKRVLVCALVACSVSLAAPVRAQRAGPGLRGGPGGGPGAGPGGGPAGQEPVGVTPAEIQRMFDAYALLQAQDQLKVSDEQYSQFLTRFKALQDVRRQALQQRTRAVMALRQLLNEQQPDEAQIREQLKSLDDIEVRAAADAKKAYEAIDQILDVRQQAKFRVFEELMERRKLDLVTRARLANRPKPQQ